MQSAPSMDMSLNKTTHLTERTSLQFRAKAFNLINAFGYFRQGFNDALDSADFGKIIEAKSATTATLASRGTFSSR